MNAVPTLTAVLLTVAACSSLGDGNKRDLSVAPTIEMPRCEEPAPIRPWTVGAEAFYFEYRSRSPMNIARTAEIAQLLGFSVLASSEGSFTVRWLDPGKVAALRCMREIALAAYVIPAPIVVGPIEEPSDEQPNNSLQRP